MMIKFQIVIYFFMCIFFCVGYVINEIIFEVRDCVDV